MRLYRIDQLVFILSMMSFLSLECSASKSQGSVVMASALVQYRMDRGNCPMESSKDLVARLTHQFEQHRQVQKLRQEFFEQQYDRQFFIKDFSFIYDPFHQRLHLTWQCYRPILKIELYQTKTKKLHLSSLLSEELTLLDPNMENMLIREKMLQKSLPYFSLDTESFDKGRHVKVVDFIKRMDPDFFKLVAEFILSNNDELTLVLRKSMLKNIDPLLAAPSYFLGDKLWDEKLSKMLLIHRYFEQRKKYPSMVNLLSMKKVVVKFSSR